MPLRKPLLASRKVDARDSLLLDGRDRRRSRAAGMGVESTRSRSSPTRLAAPPPRATGDDRHRHRVGARFSRVHVTNLPSPTPKGAEAYIALPRRLYTSGIRSRIVQTAETRSGCKRARGCFSITTILGVIDRMQTIRLRDRMERRTLSEPQSRCTLDDILRCRVELRLRHDHPPRIVRAFVLDRPGRRDLERRSSGIYRTPRRRSAPLTRQEFVR